MKAAVVRSVGQVPAYTDFASAIAMPGQQLVEVKAAALSPFTRGRALGKHLSYEKSFPFVAGYDGVGVTKSGQRVYFALPDAPYGAIAEYVALAPKQCVPLPDDIDNVTAAALANPGMSSWLALRDRAVLLPGETVLINGATGAAGGLAVQIARHLGAGRVIATGRDPGALEQLPARGADEVISLAVGEDEQLACFEAVFANGVDIVLDYLWGVSARLILDSSAKSLEGTRPLRFVQIGAMSGGEINLPAGHLRQRPIVLMGSPGGSLGMKKVFVAIREMLSAAGKAGLKIETEPTPMANVTEAWTRETGKRRLVFCP